MDRIEISGEKVAGFTMGEVAIAIVAEDLYYAAIDETNSGM